MKKIFLFLSVFTLCLADPIILQDNFGSLSTVKHQITIEDANAVLTTKEVFETQFTKQYPKYFTNYTNSVFWTKVILKNDSKEQKIVIFRNPRAGIDKIDVAIYQDRTLKNSYALGDLRDQKLRPLSSVKSVFPLALYPNETVTVITRFESLGAMYLGWEILTPQKYSYTNIMEMIFYGAFGGVMLALIIYNIMMFLNLKEKTFLFYTLHAVCALWFQYAYNGMFYFLNTGINLIFLTISSWFVSSLMILFLLLFTMSFFNLKERKKRIPHLLFSFFVGINFVISLLFVYQLINPNLILYTSYFLATSFISLMFIFVFSIYAMYKHYTGALYFFIGEGFYLAALIYVTFVIGGKADPSNSLQYTLVPVGILIEMIFLSIALSKRVGDIKRDNELKNTLLIEEEKFVSVGKSIGNVTHQWKEPISQLSSQLMYLESLHSLKKDELLLSEFGSNIEQMNAVLEHMKGSVDDLYDFYSNSDHNGYFNLKKLIDMACKLQRDNLILSHINMNVICSEDIFVSGAKHAFSNVLMILIDNSIDQLTHAAIQYPEITISVQQSDDKITLLFSDNGGGIDPKIITKILTIPYTTKGEKGCGFGLHLAKNLITERLNGSLCVENGEYGAVFTLLLKKSHIGH